MANETMCGCNKNTVQEPVFSYLYLLLKEPRRYTICREGLKQGSVIFTWQCSETTLQGVSAHLVSAFVPRVSIWQIALGGKDSVSLQGKHWPGLYTAHYIILGALYSAYNSTEHPLRAQQLPELLLILPWDLGGTEEARRAAKATRKQAICQAMNNKVLCVQEKASCLLPASTKLPHATLLAHK